MLTLVIDILLVAVAAGMFFGGHYGVTRQVAALPLVVAVIDAVFAAQVTLSLTPVLSAVLVVLQLVILAGSGVLLYEDRVHARNKQARRRRRRDLARSRAAFEQAAARREQTGHRVCA